MRQDAVPRTGGQQPSNGSVPPQALLLSLLSLWVPVLSSSFFPAWTNENVGILVWLLALVPAFLLSYYRGWRGASLSLAAAMAAFALAQVVVLLIGAEAPPPQVMVGGVAVLVSVVLGSGSLSSVFHRSLAQAEEMAFTDPLTRLANRRHVLTHLRRAFAAAKRGAPLSVVLFDLDHFKKVNDRFGHNAGDRVLSEFGRILYENTREMNLAARFGGEEFLAVLDGVDLEGGLRYAERVLGSLREVEFKWGRLTVSAGVSTYERGMSSPDVLVAAADQALYRAKKAGRDRAVALSPRGMLPVQRAEPSPQGHGEHGSGELILAVDDDPAVLRVITLALRRNGYRVLETTNPEEALRVAQDLDAPLDLVLTDLVMPEMSGFRLVEILSETRKDMRVVYISGFEADEVEWAGAPGGARTFLPKPLAPATLVAAVRRTLDAPLTAGPVASPPPQETVPETTQADGGVLAARMATFTVPADDDGAQELMRLAKVAGRRDDVTARHSERVGKLAGLLAESLGVEDAAIGRVALAATLHDVGKISLPDSILKKAGELTAGEREIMMRHCEVGAELLAGRDDPLFEEAGRVARHHHERWDGQGAPDGLSGEEIPLAARITAVADAYDNLTHSRPYGTVLSAEEALQEIREQGGSRFDPDVVDALARLAAAGPTSNQRPKAAS